jgi:hypothetical protein
MLRTCYTLQNHTHIYIIYTYIRTHIRVCCAIYYTHYNITGSYPYMHTYIHAYIHIRTYVRVYVHPCMLHKMLYTRNTHYTHYRTIPICDSTGAHTHAHVLSVCIHELVHACMVYTLYITLPYLSVS